MKRLTLVIAVLCVALATGCSGVGGGPSAGSYEAGAGSTSADPGPKAASIPTLELVTVASLPKGTSTKPGTALTAGSYKPALSGKQITSVQWVVGEEEGFNRLMLSLGLNQAGTEKFEALTRANASEPTLIVLGGRVISDLVAFEPVVEGAHTIYSSELTAARPEIDKATVPAP